MANQNLGRELRSRHAKALAVSRSPRENASVILAVWPVAILLRLAVRL